MTDDELLDAFERAAVPIEDWNHRAHVRVAWLYLTRLPFDQALARMSGGIRRLNAAHGTPDSLTSGYHHTLTCAFLCAIWATIAAAGREQGSETFCDANPHVMTRTLMRLYYSRERILTWEAKARFVPPDLAALPEPPGWSPS